MLIVAGCGSRPDPIHEYARLAVGLGERDVPSLDYYYGPEDWVRDSRLNPPRLRDIAAQARALAERAPELGPSADAFRKQVAAVAARADQLAGKRLSFDEEAAVFADVPALPRVSEAQMELVRAELSQLLPGPGTLAARYEAFEQQWLIPADRLAAVLEAAVKECEGRTLTHLKLAEPGRIESEWVGDKPWNAFSLYKGAYRSRIRWNSDYPLTVDRAVALACHEAYPGHHLHNVIAEQDLVQTRKNSMLAVQPAFSPQSFLSEALASYAVDLAFTPAERELFQTSLLRSAGLPTADAARAFRVARLVEELEPLQAAIARDFVDGRLEFTRAGEELERQVLMAHTEVSLKYFSQYRTYVLGYTVGKTMARRCFDGIGTGERWVLLRKLLTRDISLAQCAAK